jgi:hypothetical protein
MSQLHERAEITLDRNGVLNTAESRLNRDFEGTVNEGSIRRFPRCSYEQFATLTGHRAQPGPRTSGRRHRGSGGHAELRQGGRRP